MNGVRSPPMISQNVTPQEIVHASARSAGFAEENLHIGGLDELSTDINSLITSRENFRLQHLDNDALLEEGLRGYKGVVSHLLQDLQQRIDEADRELRPFIEPPHTGFRKVLPAGKS